MALSDLTYSEKKATRDGFGAGLLAAADSHSDVVGLCADLTGSLKMNAFKDKYPERFFQVGIAEANMIGIASGLALSGKIPFACTFANFATGRVYDQIRQSVAYSHKNVKICASHAGLTLGEDGATHQILEDLGMMTMLPGFTVINTCDYHQTLAATKAITEHDGPVYLRFGRPSWPMFMSDQPFEIGKAIHLQKGTDVTIIAIGHLMWYAIEASKKLAEQGISVDLINIHTVKPLDSDAILESVARTGCIVTCEEHQRHGGLGDRVAQVLAHHHPAPMEYVAVDDSFGESGKPEQLLTKYGLSPDHIYQAVHRVLERR